MRMPPRPTRTRPTSRRGLRLGAVALAALLGPVVTGTIPPAHADPVSEVNLSLPDLVPVGLAATSDGSVWFGENAGELGRVGPDGKVTEYAVPANSQGKPGGVEAVKAGSDGKVWFTDPTGAIPRVGYADPAGGELKVFEVPITGTVNFAGARLSALAAGADGAVWFGGAGKSSLGRIDASGTVTAYATTIAPYAITVGPDQAVYYTGKINPTIQRLDPATGQVTSYNLPAGGNPVLGDLVTGPDGAIWYTRPGTGKIGRLDLATGTPAEYAVRTADSAPEGIAVGSDGNLWFTEAGASNIGRINPTTKAVTEYPLPSLLSTPMRIIGGPGGKLWFTMAGKGALGSLDPASPPAGTANKALAPRTAGTVPNIAAKYQGQCPTTALACQTVITTGGTTKVGSFSLAMPPGALRITGYLTSLAPGSTLSPPVIGQQMVSTPVEVPGGLIGQLPLIGPILGMSPIALWEFNKLTVTQELAGPIEAGLGAGGIQSTAKLNIRLNNGLLGPNCVIGPVTASLTPVVRSSSIAMNPNLGPAYWGSYKVSLDSQIAVPAAKGCGLFGILDPVINSLMGLPSDAANNSINLTAILSLGQGVTPVNDVSSALSLAKAATSANTAKAPLKVTTEAEDTTTTLKAAS